jgi:antitoxin (DNA-binding transcriptional repressor) of toxin-antitoxin stability system
VARILPVATSASPRVPGIDKGKIVIMPDFDDPLEEFAV